MIDIDEQLKVIIAATTLLIGKLPKAERTWDNVQALMNQNDFVEPVAEPIFRSDKYLEEQVSFLKFDGSPDAVIGAKAKTWFDQLIQDADILAATTIDIEFCKRLVGQSGKHIESVAGLLGHESMIKENLLDIGVLRYPSLKEPYFKIYHIQISVWAYSSRVLIKQEDKNGIEGVFHAQCFRPNASVIAGMAPAAKAKAISQANALFGF